MRTIFKVGAIVLIVAVVIYAGITIYANFIDKSGAVAGKPQMPKLEDAQYSLLIKNTGALFLVDKYDLYGEAKGSRVYVLHGYWELVGNKFEFRKSDLVMSEQVYGELVFKKRTQ